MTGVMRGKFMRKASAADARSANETPVVPFPHSEERFTVFSAIVAVLKDIWPRKTISHASYATGVSERAVKYWLAGETRMSLEHVVALLRTDDGYLILEAVMGDCKADWWITTKNAQALRITRRQIAEAQKRLDAIKAGQAQLDIFQQ